jgi:predicted metal-dependent enzyme (double-stranded beta helix superfamily)
MAQAHPDHYQQNLLHRDPLGRFSVVSFVWGPGQQTPIHDHLMWGVIGMLRGAEICTPYRLLEGRPERHGDEIPIRPGDVGVVSPSLGDIHRVRNASAETLAISIHCYGGDIGRTERHSFTPGSTEAAPFVSGYSNVPA